MSATPLQDVEREYTRPSSALRAEYGLLLWSSLGVLALFLLAGSAIVLFDVDRPLQRTALWFSDSALLGGHAISCFLGVCCLVLWVLCRFPGCRPVLWASVSSFLLLMVGALLIEAFVLRPCFLNVLPYSSDPLDFANRIRVLLERNPTDTSAPCGFSMRQVFFLMPALMLLVARRGEPARSDSVKRRRLAGAACVTQLSFIVYLAIGRVARGSQFPSDILLGIALGLALYWLVFGLLLFGVLRREVPHVFGVSAGVSMTLMLAMLFSGDVSNLIALWAGAVFLCMLCMAWPSAPYHSEADTLP